MRLLLDTHIALWAVLGQPRLSIKAMAMIADPGNEVAVSMASLWEIAIKSNLGRPARDPIDLSLAESLKEFAAASFAILPIELRHVAEVERLPHPHGDPFDRLLVATAIADTWRLMTHDNRLAAYGSHIILV